MTWLVRGWEQAPVAIEVCLEGWKWAPGGVLVSKLVG